jgi:3'(2'), 5'-bisphosphate nucleotidase
METNLILAIRAAVEAGKAILEVYESDFGVTLKDDKSPLTEADRRSHAVIVQRLDGSKYPVLSEEGRDIPYAERCTWDTLWIVDPLDGTKEFIKRNGEFTVNIALVDNGRPVMGVIYVPVQKTLYFADAKLGAFKLVDPQMVTSLADTEATIRQPDLLSAASVLPDQHSAGSTYTVVGSRSHPSPELKRFVEERKQAYPDLQFVAAGSSLKFCLVAEGRANIYPRLGPTMEWDTAAGQAIAECAGAQVLRWGTSERLAYNKADLLNPWFVVKKALTNGEY